MPRRVAETHRPLAGGSADDAPPRIEDHGAIGNLSTVALVAADGAVSWWCAPDFDSPSVFASLLDPERGGTFQVRAARMTRGWQRYRRHTNILETTHETPAGRLLIYDFMSVPATLDEAQGGAEAARLVRMLYAPDGPIDVDMTWAPRFDYARRTPQLRPTDDGFVATFAGGDAPLWLSMPGRSGELITAADGHEAVVARFTLRADETFAVATALDDHAAAVTTEAAQRLLNETERAWLDWVHKDEATGERAWAGEWSEAVIRSELALKLLAYARTGAIVAAPTTSLPEWIGGSRNWDYRYAWIRDASLAAQAFFALGHRREGEAFVHWSETVARTAGEEPWGLRILYDIHGRTDLPESELPHLRGYRNSTPVRIGNGAAEQLQLDVYGELISAAYEILRLDGELAPEILRFLPHLADTACVHENEPDYGIWEVRNGPDRFVYSQAMVWLALDRATRMAERGWINGRPERWRRTMARIRRVVLDEGYDRKLGAFTQRFGSGTLDASNLLLPFLEIVEFDDPRVASTIDRTLDHLVEADLVYRYHAKDGIDEPEGAMGLCTFWLADALALSGRLDEAYRVFEGMVRRASPPGLYAEQIDPASGRFLGNYPQAYTHLGLINSALYLAYMEGRPLPVPPPIGTKEHRDT